VVEQRKTVAAQVDDGMKLLKAQGVTVTEVDKAKFAAATKDVPALVADQVPPALVQRIRDVK
jgi:TRAP-type C4-dicarboxylate transport system substrate-binding protein